MPDKHIDGTATMDKDQPGKQNTQQFRVTQVEPIDPPEGMPDGEWHSYIIEHESSRIDGKRPGTRRAVTRYAEDYAENLNERSSLGYSAYAARKGKK
jgi:hypothetical protein